MTSYISGEAGSFRGIQGAISPCREYGLCSCLRVASFLLASNFGVKLGIKQTEKYII